MERKDIRPAIKEWARWYMKGGSGYSDSTTIYRAMKAPIHPPPGSQIPRGVIPWAGIEDICYAMNRLLEVEHSRKAISAMRYFYCYGPDRAAAELRLKKTQVYELKTRGENLLCGKLREAMDD